MSAFTLRQSALRGGDSLRYGITTFPPTTPSAGHVPYRGPVDPRHFQPVTVEHDDEDALIVALIVS